MGLACRRGDAELVDTLLARPELKINKGSPLNRACAESSLRIIEKLLLHPDIEIDSKECLEAACSRSHESEREAVVEKLILMSADASMVSNVVKEQYEYLFDQVLAKINPTKKAL